LNIETLDGGTQGMDATEFGAYMRLLVCCYKADNQISTCDKRLARMVGVSPRVWKNIKDVVLSKFEQIDGYWSHERVRKELVKYQTLSQKNKANALKKNKTPKPVGKPKTENGTANTNNHHQVTTSITNVIESPPSNFLMPDGSFLSFKQLGEYLWGLYPSVGRRKGHKTKFIEQIKRHLKKGADHETIIKGITAYGEYCRNQGEFNKDAERWARDAEWDNDYSSGQTPHKSHAGAGNGKRDESIHSLIGAAEQAKKMLGGVSED
jgi:uncharacterized protein YdaU (DUF1376 family)